MKYFNGTKFAKILDSLIQAEVEQNLPDKSLVIIQIGDDPASTKYTLLKKSYCEKLNIPVELHKFNDLQDVSFIENSVLELINSSKTKSVIIQLPLNKNFKHLQHAIPLQKDVDVLSKSSRKLYISDPLSSNFIPPTVRTARLFIDTVINESNVLTTDLNVTKDYINSISHINYQTNKINAYNYSNVKIAILGKGELVGEPIYHYLSCLGFDTYYIDNYKRNNNVYDERLNLADFVVLGIGQPNLVDGQSLKQNSNVIDFGTTKVNGKLNGDFNINSKVDHLNYVSPCIGGLGPLVIRFLVMNHLGI